MFSEPACSATEGRDLAVIATLKKTSETRIANPITINIAPITIPEARRKRLNIPTQAQLENNEKSPFEAGIYFAVQYFLK